MLSKKNQHTKADKNNINPFTIMAILFFPYKNLDFSMIVNMRNSDRLSELMEHYTLSQLYLSFLANWSRENTFSPD